MLYDKMTFKVEYLGDHKGRDMEIVFTSKYVYSWESLAHRFKTIINALHGFTEVEEVIIKWKDGDTSSSNDAEIFFRDMEN